MLLLMLLLFPPASSHWDVISVYRSSQCSVARASNVCSFSAAVDSDANGATAADADDDDDDADVDVGLAFGDGRFDAVRRGVRFSTFTILNLPHGFSFGLSIFGRNMLIGGGSAGSHGNNVLPQL